ncbi:hypothetical protein EYF80_065839 [Liparis tanakae]|uniref:Uncharacterized protein n=1 Tax=Liparis tanakae TaxID=230148 RepID=A0A4Z2E5H6_9TELE|nr:hypothetical protein EYF80_065839 [Liparis tanakae]
MKLNLSSRTRGVTRRPFSGYLNSLSGVL